MSNNPIFSIQIDYLDYYDNIQTIDIPLSKNQNIEISLLGDKKLIHDKKYLRHVKAINMLDWFTTKY